MSEDKGKYEAGPIDLSKLKKPFPAKDIEWRVQRSGIKNGKPWAFVLAYVTNRAIMERLDDVCGPQNWKNYFEKGPDGGILCGISIKCGGEWVTKWDGAANTDIEAVKGGLSGSMKRAGSQWGIGRYLYNLEANFATITDKGKHSGSALDDKKSKTFFKWDPPALPKWALPEGDGPRKPSASDPKNPKNTVPELTAQQVRDQQGWISAGLAEITAGRSPADWWKEFGEKVKEDCTVEGAKEVYNKVVAK